jgi:peroxiredoxin
MREPLTWLSALLTAVGMAVSLTCQGPWGPLLIALANGCVLLEFKTHTGPWQLVMVLVSALVLGASLDMGHAGVPCMVAATGLAGLTIVLRQRFISSLTYTRYLWLEPLLLSGCIVLASPLFSSPGWQWQHALLPLLPFGFACSLTFGYVQDGAAMARKLINGYRVQVGQPAPYFELADQDGDPVSLAHYRGKHPVLLLFVRGDWCPGCHIMLRTYEKHHERFLEKGIHVLAIGPDSVEVNRDLVERIGVGYQLLSDPQQQVSDRYGVIYNNPILQAGTGLSEGIPLPASFLVDVNGIVRYVSRPDRIGEFLDPATIFQALAQLPSVEEPQRKAA